MSAARPRDRLLRWIGIPAFGLSIPHVAGLLGPYGPSRLMYWLGLAWFLALSWIIWHGNRWLLLREREHVDWFRDPLQKLLLLLVGVVLGTIPVTVAMLVGWYAIAGFAAVDWRAIQLVVLTNVICVVFVTHVYETVFLIKEREADAVRVERLERARTEVQLESLRAQVDPHFLFNSLNTLAHLCQRQPRPRRYVQRQSRARLSVHFVESRATSRPAQRGDRFRGGLHRAPRRRQTCCWIKAAIRPCWAGRDLIPSSDKGAVAGELGTHL